MFKTLICFAGLAVLFYIAITASSTGFCLALIGAIAGWSLAEATEQINRR